MVEANEIETRAYKCQLGLYRMIFLIMFRVLEQFLKKILTFYSHED